MRGFTQIAAALIVSVLVFAACSTAATVQTRSGEVAIGTISGASTTDQIVLDLDDGRRVGILRDRVLAVDHPGATTRNTGIVLAVLGVAGIVTPIIGSAVACGGADSLLCSLDWLYVGSVTVPLGAISFFSGTGMALWGAGALSDSEAAYAAGLRNDELARGVSFRLRF